MCLRAHVEEVKGLSGGTNKHFFACGREGGYRTWSLRDMALRKTCLMATHTPSALRLALWTTPCSTSSKHKNTKVAIVSEILLEACGHHGTLSFCRHRSEGSLCQAEKCMSVKGQIFFAFRRVVSPDLCTPPELHLQLIVLQCERHHFLQPSDTLRRVD